MKSKIYFAKYLRFFSLIFFLFIVFLTKVSSGQIIFQSGFEGPDPLSGFTNNQHCCDYSVTVSTTQSREGKQSFRSEVRSTDPNVSRGWRAELTTPGIRDTGDMWYGWSMYFETPESEGYWTGGYGGHFVQWHPANSTGSASLALWGSDGIWDVSTNPEGDKTSIHHAPDKMKIKANVWHDVVFHINWSTGIVQFWLNNHLFVDLTDIDYAGGPGQYFKFGMNKWGNGTGGSPTHTWIIYYDNLKIGRNVTYKDVAPLFSGL